LSTACAGDSQGPAPGPQAVPVTVATVTQETVPVTLDAIGTVVSPSTVSVRARVGGEITAVHFREGDDVRRGQVLFTIDPEPLRGLLREAEARLARDRALAENAAQEVERYRGLVEQDYVTREQFDAKLADATAQKATVAADEAAVDNARLQLSYATVEAPISGRTGSVLVHAGNVIKANDDKALVVIQQVEPIEVRFAVPQRHLAEIRARQAAGTLEVSAQVPDSATSAQQGTLSFIDNAVDSATGTIQLKARFPNRQRLLWPGQFVKAAMTLSTQQRAVVVPAPAVQTGQSGDYVFVVQQDQTVDSRPVRVDRTLGQRAVIAEGLAPGETVVTDGQLRLAPGSRIEIKEKGPDSEEVGT
jgi:multidrug efflux system membrane fusion protein